MIQTTLSTPSADWTYQDRLGLIAEISLILGNRCISGRLNNVEVLDAMERVNYLCLRSAEFLESNREEILHGNPPSTTG